MNVSKDTHEATDAAHHVALQPAHWQGLGLVAALVVCAVAGVWVLPGFLGILGLEDTWVLAAAAWIALVASAGERIWVRFMQMMQKRADTRSTPA